MTKMAIKMTKNDKNATVLNSNKLKTYKTGIPKVVYFSELFKGTNLKGNSNFWRLCIWRIFNDNLFLWMNWVKQSFKKI